MNRELHQIDATNKAPGRLAGEIVRLLMGKHKTSYQPHADEGDLVEVSNVEAMKLDRKYTNTQGYRFSKVYYSHSRYPGGLKETQAVDVAPAEILRKAVLNMLPKNRLQPKMIKRLKIK